MKSEVSAMTLDDLIAKFLGRFADGFHDAAYLGGEKKKGERHYKLQAHEKLVKMLDEARARSVDAVEAARSTSRIVSSLNLLYSGEQAALFDAFKDAEAAASYADALARFLAAGEPEERAWNDYARMVQELPAERGPVAKWTVATVAPYLAQPDRHMFLKPKATKFVAKVLRFELNYKAQLNWLTYKRLLEMADVLHDRLAHLKPRDYIDIQSFIWQSFDLNK